MGKRIEWKWQLPLRKPWVFAILTWPPFILLRFQSHIAEHLSDLVANGEIDAEFVTVESGDSAMSAVIELSGAGARAFTANKSSSGVDADARTSSHCVGDAPADLHGDCQPGGFGSLKHIK